MIQIDMPMPDNCVQCRFNVSEFGYCNAMPVNFCGCVNDFEKDGKPEWCPLKAQEPRVMGVDEVWEWVGKQRVDREPICVEVKDNICAWIVSDEYWDMQMDINLSSDLYGKTWRCWTADPTDEQRGATPWKWNHCS